MEGYNVHVSTRFKVGEYVKVVASKPGCTDRFMGQMGRVKSVDVNIQWQAFTHNQAVQVSLLKQEARNGIAAIYYNLEMIKPYLNTVYGHCRFCEDELGIPMEKDFGKILAYQIKKSNVGEVV